MSLGGFFPPAIPSPRVSTLPPTAGTSLALATDGTEMPSWWQPLGPALNTWPDRAPQPAEEEKPPPAKPDGPRLQTLELENIRLGAAIKKQAKEVKEQQVRLQKAAELLRELDAENSVLREELAAVKANKANTAESVRALEAEITRLRKAFLNAELGGKKAPTAAPAKPPAEPPAKPPSRPADSVLPQDPPNPEEGKLRVKFVRATNLPSVGSFDPDCYIKFMWRGEKHKTAVQDGTNNPVWNESFELSVNKSEYNTPIVVKVWDKNALSSNEWIGECDIHFDKLRKGKTVTENYGLIKLSPRANRPSRGSVIELTVELTAVDFNTAPRPEAEQGAKQAELETKQPKPAEPETKPAKPDQSRAKAIEQIRSLGTDVLLNKIWEALDSDASGSIERNEVRYSSLFDVLEPEWDDLDADASGRVSRKEWSGFMNKIWRKKVRQPKPAGGGLNVGQGEAEFELFLAGMVYDGDIAV